MRQQTADRRPFATGKVPEPGGRDFPADSSHVRANPASPRKTFRIPASPLPAFHLVIAGTSISMLGTKISTLAFPMLVLWLGGSPALAGFAVFATVMPGVLLYFPAGIIVDKMNPWWVMVCSEISRGVVALSVAIELLKYHRHANIKFLIFAIFAEEVLEIFTTLAERRYLNGMMPSEESKERRSQQASIEARAHVAVLAGRPVAPFLFTLNPMLPFFADAASFIFSVAGLLPGRRHKECGKPRNAARPDDAEESATSGHPESGRRADGVRGVIEEVRRDNRIWLGGLLMSMTSMVSQALILIFLTEAYSRQFSTAEISIVLAVSGLGGAAGSYCSRFMPDAIRTRWIPVQMMAWLVICSALALTGGRSAWWSGCTMFIFSVTGAIGNVEFSTYLNLKIHDNMLGKVSGIGYAMSIGACALGPVIGGYSAQQFGVQSAVILLLCIVGLMAIGSVFLLRNSRGERDQRTTGPAAVQQMRDSLPSVMDKRRLAAAPLAAVPAPEGEPAGVPVEGLIQLGGRRFIEILPPHLASPSLAPVVVLSPQPRFASPAKESTMVDNS